MRLIGEGGMAKVYEAEHIELGTQFAIKILNPEWAVRADITKRFSREARIMASLKHENVVRIYDYFQDRENNYAIVMELLEGEDLSSFIKRQGALSNELAYDLMTKILGAFEYAHNKGLVHRDVKPGNIFITPEKNVKILDFGIAKLNQESNAELTRTGIQMGTPMYMSPEQVKDTKHLDKRSDIYSLGVVFHFILTGKPPYDSGVNSNYEIFEKIVNEPLPLLRKHDEFNELISVATDKKPSNRFHSCEDFKGALKKIALAKAIERAREKEREKVKSESFTENEEFEEKLEFIKLDSVPPSNRKPNAAERIALFIILLILFVIVASTINNVTKSNSEHFSNATSEIDNKSINNPRESSSASTELSGTSLTERSGLPSLTKSSCYSSKRS